MFSETSEILHAYLSQTVSSHVCPEVSSEKYFSAVVSVAVPLASWGTTAATRVPRLRIGERPREWTRG